VALQSLNGSDISVLAANTANGVPGGAGTLADVKALGLNETSNGTGFSSSAVSASALSASDDLKINGVKIGSSTDASALAKAAAINAASGASGVTASARTQAKVAVDLTATPGAANITINGSVVDLSAATSLSDVVASINASGVNGLRASADQDGNLILTSEQGADIALTDTGAFFTAATSTSGEAGTGALASGLTIRGRLTLDAANNGDIRVEGSTASLAKSGLAAQGGTSDMIGGNLDISSQANAAVALKAIDDALDKVSANRGNLGAVQNRLETTVNNLTNIGTNLSAARSRIQETDFAAETTALAKSQILSQAATAMLAQANQSQQNVMSLLR
jgi:flagellin